MTDYFRYDVHFVMNITDIDDKVSFHVLTEMLTNDLDRLSSALEKTIFLKSSVQVNPL